MMNMNKFKILNFHVNYEISFHYLLLQLSFLNFFFTNVNT